MAHHLSGLSAAAAAAAVVALVAGTTALTVALSAAPLPSHAVAIALPAVRSPAEAAGSVGTLGLPLRAAGAKLTDTPRALPVEAPRRPAPSSPLSWVTALAGAVLVLPAALLAVRQSLRRKAYLPLEPLPWSMVTVIDVHSAERKLFHMTADQRELVGGMTEFIGEKVLPLASNVDKNWQPNDLLPDPTADDFLDQVKDLRQRSLMLPDDFLVVLVGDMVTEEALPTYMTMLNTLEKTRDQTGADPTPWAQWTRKWTAEENRHGDALNKYLYLSGRVDMRAIEGTIQRLIGSGMNPGTDNNPYLGYIYTSFQERATKVSHGNTARMAKEAGDLPLAKMCGLIAADEGRHEVVYQRIVSELFQRDPSGTMLALADMLRKQITMPAHLMDDGVHAATNSGRSLFTDYATVAENLKVYTAEDYTDILEHLIKLWDVASLTGLTPAAQEAQDYVCKLPGRYRKLAARVAARKKAAAGPARFSWIRGREVAL